MAQFQNIYPIDLNIKKKGAQDLLQPIGEGDANGVRVGAQVFADGAPVTLNGQCVAKVIRADGSTVPLTGTISGNIASVALDQQSCAVEGPIQVAVMWVSGTNVTTLVIAYGTIVNTTSGTIIQPSAPIPDLTQLLAEIEAMRQATAAANAAAEKSVRYDITQTLDATQQARARGNISAPSAADLAATKAELAALADGKAVRYDTAQTLVPSQMRQGRDNLNAADALEANIAGSNFMGNDLFMRGSLDQGTVTDVQYRIVLRKIARLTFPVTVVARTGFRVYVAKYYENGNYRANSGWQTSYTVPKDTNFRITIARDPDDTTETATINTFTGNVIVYHGEVRYDSPQALSEASQAQARANIGAADETAVNTTFESIAPEYDPINGTYEVGYYVRHNNQFYRCKTPVTTPETFKPEKWQIVYLGNDITAAWEAGNDDLKSAIHERIADTVGFIRTNLFISSLTYSNHNVYTSACTVTLNGDAFTLTPTGANPRFGNTLPEGDALNPNLPYGYPFPVGGSSSLWVEISNDVFNRNYVTFFDENLVSLGFTDYIATSNFEVPVMPGATYAMLRIGSNKTTVGTPYEFTVRCYDLSDGKITALQMIDENAGAIRSNTELEYKTYPGYWSNTGSIISPGAETQEVYTNYIPASYGDTFDLEIILSTAKSMWAVYVLFDANMGFLSRTALISNMTGDNFQKSITVTNTSAAYISLSYRTYGIANVTLIGHTVAKTLYKMIPGSELVHYTNPIVKGINHRGYVSAPENTLPAFRLSRKMGFEYVETDVEFTSDGVPVLLHDTTINRTARNADGTALSETINIHDITYEQALTYDFGIYKGENYAGTKIPTVEQFFALCRNLGLCPYVEFKTGTEYTQAQVESVIDIAKRYGMGGKVSWISFNGDYLAYVKNYDSKARIGYVCESPGDNQIAVILSLRTDDNEVFADCHYSSINSTGAGKCIRNGIPLEAWTLNAKADLAALNPYVTGVTTDSLDIAQTLYWQGMA